MRRIVIVGASLAGIRSAEALRRMGFDGELTVVGDEVEPPYDRPPLSKQLLAGSWEVERIRLRVEPTVEADLRLGVRATELDVPGAQVMLSDGHRLSFDGLVIATGAAPRTLPGTDELDGVFVLRTLADCLALRRQLEQRPRVVVIGGGFIGSEVAATCRARGLEVTVVEALPLPLARVLPPAIGQACATLHGDHGTSLVLGVGVAGLEADGGGRIARVRLADGSALEADVVVVGIGVAPVTGWLEGSGLELADGVVCDAWCRASGPPAVVAAGDVARWYNPLFAESMRVEHWTNAVEQGEFAASVLLHGADKSQPFAPVPYFWSDQYDTKIQMVGRAGPADDLVVVEGSVAERRFVAAVGRNGQLVGAIAFNRPARVMAYRSRIAERTTFPPVPGQESGATAPVS